MLIDKPEEAGLVDELKRQLREKDLVLTDIRLEALSSAHQLESLKDTVIKMRVRSKFYFVIFISYLLTIYFFLYIVCKTGTTTILFISTK